MQSPRWLRFFMMSSDGVILPSWFESSLLFITDNGYASKLFFLSILWCNQSGDYPLEDLAKFCYKLNMEFKILKKKTFYIFWLPTWTMYRVGIKKSLVKLLDTIENLEKHLIFALLIFNFSFWLYSQQKKAGTTMLQCEWWCLVWVNFAMYPKWWWSTWRFSQFWQAKYEIKILKTSFSFLATLFEPWVEIWCFFLKFGWILSIENLKKHTLILRLHISISSSSMVAKNIEGRFNCFTFL